jgi:hypothetical protein
MLRWVIAGELARDCRSGCSKGRALPAAKGEVDKWIHAAKRYQIQSLICLLSEEQLTGSGALPTDLLAYYRQQGFQVAQIPMRDPEKPPFSEEQLRQVWDAYLRLPKPLLVHGPASSSPAKQAVAYILQCRARQENTQ